MRIPSTSPDYWVNALSHGISLVPYLCEAGTKSKGYPGCLHSSTLSGSICWPKHLSWPSQDEAGVDLRPQTGPSAVLCQKEHTAVEPADLNWDRQFRPWFIDTVVDLHCLGSSFPFCSPLPSWYSWHLEKEGVLKALPVPGDSRTRKCFLAIPYTKYGPLPLCLLDRLYPGEIRTGIGP